MNPKTDDQLFRTEHASYYKSEALDDDEPLLRRSHPSRASLRISSTGDTRDLNRQTAGDTTSFISSIANIVRVASTKELSSFHKSERRAGEAASNSARVSLPQTQRSQALQVHRRSASSPEGDTDSVDLEDLRHRIVLHQIANSGPLSNLKSSLPKPRTPSASFRAAPFEDVSGAPFPQTQEEPAAASADRAFGFDAASPDKLGFEVRAWEVSLDNDGPSRDKSRAASMERRLSSSRPQKGSPPPTNDADLVELRSHTRSQGAHASISSSAMVVAPHEPPELAPANSRMPQQSRGADGGSPSASSRILVLVSPFPVRTSPERPQQPWSLAVTPPPANLPLTTQRRNIALLSPSFDVEDEDTRHALGHLHYRISSVRALFALQNCERSESIDREGILKECWLSAELLRLQSAQHLERLSIVERERHQSAELFSRLQTFIKAAAHFFASFARLGESELANRRGLEELESSSRRSSLTDYFQYLQHWSRLQRDCLQAEEDSRTKLREVVLSERYHIQSRSLVELETIWRRQLLLTPVLPTTFGDSTLPNERQSPFMREFDFHFDYAVPSLIQMGAEVGMGIETIPSRHPFHRSPLTIDVPISLLSSERFRSNRSLPCSVSEYFSKILPQLFLLFIEEGNRIQLLENENNIRMELYTEWERKRSQFARLRIASNSTVGPSTKAPALDFITFAASPSMAISVEGMRRTPQLGTMEKADVALDMERLMPNVALLTTMEFSNRTYWTAMEELQRHWLSSRARLSRREGTEHEQLSSMMRADAPKQQLKASSNSSTTVPVSEHTYVATVQDGRRDATASKRAVPTVAELFKLSDVHAQGRVTLAAVAGALRILALPFNLQLLSQHFKAAQMRRADRMHRTESSLSYTEFCDVCEASALLTGHVKAPAFKAETEGAYLENSHRTGPSKPSPAAPVTVNTPQQNDRKLVPGPDPEQAKPASRRLVSPKRNRDQSESSNSDSGLPLHHHIATLSVPSARPAAADLSEEQRRQCEAMFRRADKDDDGYLTRDELQRLLRRCGLLDDDSLTQEDFDDLLSNARALAPTNPTIERDLVDSQQFQLIMARVLRS